MRIFSFIFLNNKLNNIQSEKIFKIKISVMGDKKNNKVNQSLLKKEKKLYYQNNFKKFKFYFFKGNIKSQKLLKNVGTSVIKLHKFELKSFFKF
jgi:hypothetical protein